MITKPDLAAAQKACDDYTLTEPDFTPAALPPVSPPSDGILSAQAGVSDLAPTSDLSADGRSIPTANVHPGVGVTLQDKCRSLISCWRSLATIHGLIGGSVGNASRDIYELCANQLERLLK